MVGDQNREPDHDQPGGLVLVPELVEGSHPLTSFTPPKLANDPLAIYISQLRSAASRRSILSMLTRAARIFDAMDREIDPDDSTETAASYPWGTPGALTFVKAQAAVSIIAEEPSPGHEEEEDPPRKVAAARLLASGLKGLARAAFSLRLLDVAERQRIDDIKPPKSTGSERGQRLTDAEVARLYDACARDDSPLARRDAAILSILLGAGLRRFEAAALDLADYQRPATAGRDPVRFTIRRGKGAKPATVPGPPDLAFAIADWLAVRGEEPGPLFYSSSGRGRRFAKRRISASGIYLVVTTRGREAGISLAPHDLRRTAITVFLERHGDLALAQQFARHSSPATTTKYDKRGVEALVRAFAGARAGYIAPATDRRE